MAVGEKVVLLVEHMGDYLHPHIELGLLKVYTHMYIMVLWTHQRRGGLSHYQNLTSLSAFGTILKDFFFKTDAGWCERHTLGWT